MTATKEIRTLWSARYEYKNDKGEDTLAFTPWLDEKLSLIDYVGEKNGRIDTVYVREAGDMFELAPGGGRVPIG